MKKIIADDPNRVGAFVSRIMGDAEWSCQRAIGLEEDGELIAGVVYDNYNGASICMHVGAIPGKRWMTREFLWFAFYYPFVQLGVKRITGLVPESNLLARKFDEHLGFELEAVLQDAHPDGSVFVYRMFKDQCRFLELKHVEAKSPAGT